MASEKTNASKNKEKAINTGDFVTDSPLIVAPTNVDDKEKAINTGDLATNDLLTVLLTNNSISGHELLRGNGQFLAIPGHGKVNISTTKEELVVITEQLASKPWVEVNLVNNDAE